MAGATREIAHPTNFGLEAEGEADLGGNGERQDRKGDAPARPEVQRDAGHRRVAEAEADADEALPGLLPGLEIDLLRLRRPAPLERLDVDLGVDLREPAREED